MSKLTTQREQKNRNWIVLDSEEASSFHFACLRCGKKRKLNFQMAASELLRIGHGFIEYHKACKWKKNEALN